MSPTRTLRLLCALGLATLAATAHANPLDYFGFGARGPGMGNAHVALADDFSANYYTPAGLATRDALQLQLGYALIAPSLELNGEDLGVDAIAALVAAHRRQAHATGLISACDDALAGLAGDDGPSLVRRLQQLRGGLSRERANEPRLDEVDAMLDSAAIQLEEAALLLQRVRDDLDVDPAQFEALEAKLARLHELARKHRVAPEELAGRQAACGTSTEAILR